MEARRSLKRHGRRIVPTRLALVRRLGSIRTKKARFAGPVVIERYDVRLARSRHAPAKQR